MNLFKVLLFVQDFEICDPHQYDHNSIVDYYGCKSPLLSVPLGCKDTLYILNTPITTVCKKSYCTVNSFDHNSKGITPIQK